MSDRMAKIKAIMVREMNKGAESGGFDAVYEECGLLYIEPTTTSMKPIKDGLTKKMVAALRKAEISPIFYCGFHTCICGVTSESHDFILSNGDITNSLCVHYLAYHREDIPEGELQKVRNLADGEKRPSFLELKPKCGALGCCSRLGKFLTLVTSLPW